MLPDGPFFILYYLTLNILPSVLSSEHQRHHRKQRKCSETRIAAARAAAGLPADRDQRTGCSHDG